MTDSQVLQEVLNEVKGINTRIGGLETRFDGLETRFDGLETRFDGLETHIDTLDKKVDTLGNNLAKFQIEQEEYNATMWTLSNQAFGAISDIRNEVVSPWKIRQSK